VTSTIEAESNQTPPAHQRPPLWRDVRILRIVGQVVSVIGVLLILRWLLNNLFDNLEERNISTDFDFLDQPTNFQIAFDDGFDPRSPVREMVLVGIRNTLLAASVGIVIAMVLGTVIGIARLSTNWLVAKMATVYVEVFRNIPPLIIIIFFGAALFTFGPFPVLSGTSTPDIYHVPGSDSAWLVVSKTVWGIPSLATENDTGPFWIFGLVGLVVAAVIWLWRTRVNIATGAPHHRVLWSGGALLVILVVAWLVFEPYRWSFPSVSENGRRIENGFIANFGWISITIALGLYTASHIAEIVRGSILAVPRGQTEATQALALSGFQRYRFVVLPQAMRIAIPPIINQFLNLTKNTSLAPAVAYAEITALTSTSIGNGRPAVQSLVILIAIYLSFSIVISIAMNLVNRRLQLADR
jgi:general L-amino acid transport system permease protein